MTIGKTVFNECFGLSPAESVLIVTDPGKKEEAALLFESAKEFTSRVAFLSFEGMTENAQEPPGDVLKALCRSDVALLVTTYSLSHTTARKMANRRGTRIASLPGITIPMMERTLTSDYRAIGRISTFLADRLTQSETVRVTSPGGTSLMLSVHGREAIADTGIMKKPGDFGNLPAGEAFLAPVEGTTNGILVIDGCLADIELDAPITITIRNGIAGAIQGKRAAAAFRKAIQLVGDGASIVAEFGIGTNPNAWVTSDVLEAEKAYGTCHIAFGNNAGFGGKNDVPFHSDGVVLDPTIVLDGAPVVKKGNIQHFLTSHEHTFY